MEKRDPDRVKKQFFGVMNLKIELMINGKIRTAEVKVSARLINILREKFGLVSVREG